MVINIIDREFNFLGQIDEYESFIPTKKWHGIGNFELHLNINNAHAEYLQKENIIFTDEKKAYVILYREIDSVTNKLVVKGLELKSYLARWLVFPPMDYAYFRVNSNVETIMKEYVQATLTRKGIANIVVADDLGRGDKTVYQSRYKNLADELEKLSLASNLSWDIALDLDNKRFIFDAIEGRDVTVNQDILPPAIFSIEYDNIAEQKLTDSKLDYRNTAIVAGQGEGVDRAITVVGDSQGYDSFEAFIDARDIEDDNDLPARGTQKLSETQEILTFDSRVLTDKNLVYEEDFKLGDIVTIQNNQWNITTDRRITEITEIYESTGFRLDVAFGESLPTIIDLVKKATDTPIVEGGSEGEPGTPGQDGNDGVSIEYRWNGTELGIKREDEVNYQYANLKGDTGNTGEQGVQGVPGLNGKSLEFHWNGTQLGVRVEGETTYQYVNLKGDKGDQGIRGIQGIPGIDGKNLEFVWNGTQLGVRQEGQTSYTYVDLKGAKGDTGDTGNTGAIGKSIEFTWNGTSLGVKQEGQSTYQYVNLKGEKGDTGSDATVNKTNVLNAIGYTPVSPNQVLTDVPSGAKFTDTVYTHPASHPASMITGLPTSLPASGGNADTVGGFTVGVNVPANAKFTDTITTINGKTGTITKADITALGIPAQDTVYTHPGSGTNPHGTTKRDIGLGSVLNYSIASQQLAEAGTSNVRYMTPLRTKQAIDKFKPTKLSELQNDIGAGAGLKIITSATEPSQLVVGDQWHKEI